MGRNGAGKTTLLKMIFGASAPDAGSVRLGASLYMGYFAQQALDLLNSNLTIIEQLQQDFPHDGLGSLRTSAGAFQFSGEDVDKRSAHLWRRKVAAGHSTHALQSAELPGARRTDESLGSQRPRKCWWTP